jgi:hypothetical protein
MTSVWPALWPPWKRTTTSAWLRQPVDDLALALVAPLGADDDNIGHGGDSLFADLSSQREFWSFDRIGRTERALAQAPARIKTPAQGRGFG